MKKIIFLIAAVTVSQVAFAQKDFKALYEAKFPVKVDWKIKNKDISLVLGGDLSAMAMLDAVTGKPLWQVSFKDRFDVKSAEDWGWEEAEGMVNVTLKGDKKGEKRIIYLDERTGEVLDEATAASRKQHLKFVSNPGYEFIVPGKGITVKVEYPEKARAAFNTNKKDDLTLTASGNVSWKQSISATLVRNLCSGFAGSDKFGDVFIDLYYTDDKLFVMYEGMSVLDINTGKTLWETTFDNSENDFKLVKVTQTLGRAPGPLVAGDAVYLADFSQDEYKLKKLDANTGAVIWSSEQYNKETAITQINVVGNALVATFGGEMTVQTYVPGMNGNPDVCRSESKQQGPFGIKAYDIATGKKLWETDGMKELGDKFSGAVTQQVVTGNQVFVCSDKNCFSFGAASGKMLKKVTGKELKIGAIQRLESFDSELIVSGDEGVARLSADGAVKFATNTKQHLSSFMIGEAFYVWTGKDKDELNTFCRVDLNSGEVKGKISDTMYPYFSPDGNEFIKFEKDKVYRYSTK